MGFWRGPTDSNKVALLPAPDRWTGTPVDGWPPKVLFGLRRELLAARREQPAVTDAQLVGRANAWLRAHEPTAPTERKTKKGARAGGTPRKVDVLHIRALLTPPRRSRSKQAEPQEVDRSPRPTKLSAEDLASIIRRNRSLDSQPRATSSGRPGRAAEGGRAASKPKGKGPKSTAAQPRKRRSGKPLPRAAMRAGVSPRGSFVTWSPGVPDAVRVRLDIRDPRRGHLRTLRADVAARHAVFQAPVHGFEVTARFLDKHGRPVAEAWAEHGLRGGRDSVGMHASSPRRAASRP